MTGMEGPGKGSEGQRATIKDDRGTGGRSIGTVDRVPTTGRM